MTLTEKIRTKRHELLDECERLKLAIAQSSDYHTPPSTRVANMEGKIEALLWVLEQLEKQD